MKTKVFMLFSLCLLFVGKANAQWVVTDPSNLAQGIINATKNIVHTSSTANSFRVFSAGSKIGQSELLPIMIATFMNLYLQK